MGGVKRSALGFRAPGLRERKIMISRRKKSSQKEERVTEATGPRWPMPSPLMGGLTPHPTPASAEFPLRERTGTLRCATLSNCCYFINKVPYPSLPRARQPARLGSAGGRWCSEPGYAATESPIPPPSLRGETQPSRNHRPWGGGMHFCLNQGINYSFAEC